MEEPQGLKIVLIDDARHNHSYFARRGLRGHTVRRFSNVEAAHRELMPLTSDDVDIGLMDFWMNTPQPLDDVHYAKAADDLHAGRELPAGLAFAIRFMNWGIPVAVCSDSNHHSDRLIRLMFQTVATPLGGAGRIVVYEAAFFSVPEICYSKELRRICRFELFYRDGEQHYRLYAIKDKDKTQLIKEVRRSETRPVKDWGRVLRARLEAPMEPIGVKRNAIHLE